MNAAFAATPDQRPDRPGRLLARCRDLLEVAILAGTGAMLLQKALGGALSFYLHPRYTGLVVASGGALLLLAAARGRQALGHPGGMARRRGGYAVLLLPVLLGLLVPARPLAWSGPSAAVPGGLDAPFAGSSPEGDPRGWTIAQWRSALREAGDAPGALRGREAEVVGFVRHDARYPFDGFFVARFVIVHCVVDAVGTNLPVSWPAGGQLPPDGWVRVRGRLGTLTLDGRDRPALIASGVEPIALPRDPYLFR